MTPAIRVSASCDQVMRLMTALVVLAVGAAAVGLLLAGLASASAGMRALFFGLAALPIIVIVACAAFVPLGYRIAEDALWVERPLRPVEIPLREIRGVRPVELHGVIRALGVGGFFGAWGWFTSRELPSFRAYITRRHGLVCVELREGDPVVLSPDDPVAFVREIERRIQA